ncbi:MAG: glutamate mutase L [Anaerolineaceae bacterium]
MLSTTYYLGVEIGAKHTRAWLFDNRAGSFELRDSAVVNSSLGDSGEVASGVRAAIQALQNNAEVELFAQGSQKLAFSMTEGGLKGAGLTVSAGNLPRTVLVGVSETYSLAALRRLAALFGCEVILTIHQQDELNATAQLSRMMASNADLFVVAGGSNQGATKPIQSALDNIRIIYENMPRVVKPQVVYTGNEACIADAQAAFEGSPDVHIAGNIQPEIGLEDQTVAWRAMLKAWQRIKRAELPGLDEVERLLTAQAQPTIFAAGRVMRLLDQMNPNGKGVMALDLGQTEARVVAARKDQLTGQISRDEKDLSLAKDAHQYLSQPLDQELVEAYLLNKSLMPDMVPSTLDELTIEQALARAKISQVFKKVQELNPIVGYQHWHGLNDPYEPIILSGEIFCNASEISQALLMAVDGIQPCGITTFVLDQYQVTPVLGALAEFEPMLVVQVIDSGVYESLGTVVGVDSPEKAGKKVLEIEVDENLPERRRLTILKGELKRIETFGAEKTSLYFSPTSSSEVGMGLRGLGGWLRAYDTQVGVVIDARGRPLELASDAVLRAKQLGDWAWELSK